MAEHKEQFDDNLDLKISGKLKSDLNTLFKPRLAVPLEINRAILDKASRKLIRPRSRFYILRWAGPVAAAAAIIIFVCIGNIQKSNISQSKMNTIAKLNDDIDNSGKVDILDAFKLAKFIQSGKSIDKKWDINGDGRVDDGDVKTIAYAAVSLNKGV
jgi:hypothetical protein